MKEIHIITITLFYIVLTDGLLFSKKPEEDQEPKPAKKPLFGKDGRIHQKIEDIKNDLATKPPLFGENGSIHQKFEDLKTKPLVNSSVNARVHVLHSEVGISGAIVIGGNKTGAHMSADASILGQKARVHGDILNGQEGTGHGHDKQINEVPKIPIKEKLKETGDKIKDFFHGKKKVVSSLERPEGNPINSGPKINVKDKTEDFGNKIKKFFQGKTKNSPENNRIDQPSPYPQYDPDIQEGYNHHNVGVIGKRINYDNSIIQNEPIRKENMNNVQSQPPRDGHGIINIRNGE